MTAVALGQLDQFKALPGGPQGLVDLIRECPIMAEVRPSHSLITVLLQYV